MNKCIQIVGFHVLSHTRHIVIWQLISVTFWNYSHFLKYKQMLHHSNLPIAIISYYYAIQWCIEWRHDSWSWCWFGSQKNLSRTIPTGLGDDLEKRRVPGTRTFYFKHDYSEIRLSVFVATESPNLQCTMSS